jgi:hypothetical protein
MATHCVFLVEESNEVASLVCVPHFLDFSTV